MNAAKTDSERNEASLGFWADAWKRFRRNRMAMMGLAYVIFLLLVAMLAPAIVGTKPLVCRYQGKIYFPALGYVIEGGENAVFKSTTFVHFYRRGLKQGDPQSWAIWPLVYQDPGRRVTDLEWPGHPGNRPAILGGHPTRWCPFGTDGKGVDVFAQLVHGTRTAMLVGFVSMGIAATIGVIIGAVAGYFGGWIDILFSRLIELVMCIPSLILVLTIIAIVPKVRIWHVMVVIGITSWTSIARLTRAEFLRLRQSDYVMAAKSLGASEARIMFVHILRNSLAPIFAPITFGVASAVLLESALSYVGFGVADAPSWGRLLFDGQSTIEQTWWLVLFPGTAIFLTVLAYNLVGDGLREATDPRLREASK